jgi:hypothetical protein
LTLGGATDTVAIDGGGAAVMVSVALPLIPCVVAVTVVVPVPTVVIAPLGAIDATAASATLHVNVTPDTGLPDELSAVAVNVAVCPMVRLNVAGATVTLATCGGADATVMAAVAEMGSTVPT